MRRVLLAALTTLLIASCDSEEQTSGNATGAPEAAQPAMTTIGALAPDLPFPIPPEIPAPEDAQYIGESKTSPPYKAVQFSTAMNNELLKAELKAFATDIGGRFDESLGQVTYMTEIEGTRHFVYAWVRTNEGNTRLEIGTAEITQ